MRIGNDLIEAYKGYYEGDINDDYRGMGLLKNWEKFRNDWIGSKILSHSSKERLEVYCEWNGILGYSTRLYEIATGEL